MVAASTLALLRALLRDAGNVRRIVGRGEPLYVRGPEILLEAGDPLAHEVNEWRASRGATRQVELHRLAARLADRLVGTVASEAVAAAPEEAAGPLPTAALLMAAAGRGETEALLSGLGGLEARYRASGERRVLLQLPGLDSRSVFLLSRFENGSRIGEVLHQMPGDRHGVIETVSRLRAVGLLEPVAEAGPGDPADEEAAVLARFRDRIDRELESLPLDLAPEVHRARIADLLSGHGALDHYELLQVAPSASEDEIHRAYDDLARLIHPRHARTLALPSSAALDLLFERATNAYRMLVDPRRRSAYNLRLGIEPGERQRTSERIDEQRRMAREHYELAVRYVEAEQYHFAVELLRQALRLDARGEYQSLLGSCQARNPNWLPQAVTSYERAHHLDPQDAGPCFALGQLHERLGDADAARRRYEQAIERMPGHPEATLALERLGRGAGSGKRQKAAKKR